MRLSHKVIIIIKTRSIILHCFCDKIFSTAQTLKYKNSLYIFKQNYNKFTVYV